MLKVAHAHGFELTAEDLKPSKMDELSDDEMKAVAGGALGDLSSKCECLNGYGSGFTSELNCECGTEIGSGQNTTSREARCGCHGSYGCGV